LDCSSRPYSVSPLKDRSVEKGVSFEKSSPLPAGAVEANRNHFSALGRLVAKGFSMASISRDPNGRRRIIFVGPDRVRRAIYLGKFPQKAAETIQRHIEAIVSSLNSRSPLDAVTSEWLGSIGDDLYRKLVAARLVTPRGPDNGGPSVKTIQALEADYYAAKLKAKPATRVHWGHTWRNLREFFGPDQNLGAVTEADADKWSEWLEIEQELSLPTVHKRCGNAKAFFDLAVKSRMIPSNPFAKLKCGNVTNREKDFFLSREDASRVIDASPDAEWRLLFALSRYGGLRCPSEHLALRWVDVDWERARIRVRSPKTEHHQNGKFRMIPLFPELRPFLEDAFDPTAEHVITRYRSAKQNLRTQLVRIIKRAGLDPWPKLWHNLRATRQTELEESFPSHVVCAWIGNSERVARRHYLQVTEAHFEKAQFPEARVATRQTTRHTAQQPSEMRRNVSKAVGTGDEKTPEIAGTSAISGVFENSTDGRCRTRTCDLMGVIHAL
jgi:integrase